jgi:hypothetical protein
MCCRCAKLDAFALCGPGATRRSHRDPAARWSGGRREDAYGNTPLWRAVSTSGGQGRVVGHLLAAGADPDLANRAGVSPRQLAERIANYDVRSSFRRAPDDSLVPLSVRICRIAVVGRPSLMR